MAGFELWTSGIERTCSPNLATTTAQRTLTIGESITVWLTCLTGLDLTKHIKLLFIQQKQSS